MDTKLKIGVVVENTEGKILLIKEKLEQHSEPLWNIIKGTYDGGESVFETALRECHEEANITAELTGVLNIGIEQTANAIRTQINFLASTKDTQAHISDAETQAELNEYISEVRWFEKGELENLDPEDFTNKRSHAAVQSYLSKNRAPLEIVTQIEKG